MTHPETDTLKAKSLADLEAMFQKQYLLNLRIPALSSAINLYRQKSASSIAPTDNYKQKVLSDINHSISHLNINPTESLDNYERAKYYKQLASILTSITPDNINQYPFIEEVLRDTTTQVQVFNDSLMSLVSDLMEHQFPDKDTNDVQIIINQAKNYALPLLEDLAEAHEFPDDKYREALSALSNTIDGQTRIIPKNRSLGKLPQEAPIGWPTVADYSQDKSEDFSNFAYYQMSIFLALFGEPQTEEN